MARSVRAKTATGPKLPGGGSGTGARILSAGLELFAEMGFHATSIRDIAAAAGVQSGSLYSHFASKEAVLAELVFIGHDEHHRLLLSAVLEAGSEPAAQLAAIMRTHVLAHCEFPELGVVSNHEMHNLSPEAAAPALALRHRSEELLREVLERGQRDGVFHLAHLEATGAAIGSLGTSVSAWWPDASNRISAPELADAYAELALRMVGV